ncbi:MAG: rhodanese-like domain-containing protein [Gammaproteobacteria bacterium]|nr:rhodanese-like domain-containing protein [Gammaproteobacteria bacterium]
MNIKSINPEEALQLLRERADAVLLDVRSRVEFDYVGHPPDAVHVAWAEHPTWRPNPQQFVTQAKAALAKLGGTAPEVRPILTLCRSGGRSLAAAQALAAAGFGELYNITEGFEGERDADGHRNTINGWRQRGLPWIQT